MKPLVLTVGGVPEQAGSFEEALRAALAAATPKRGRRIVLAIARPWGQWRRLHGLPPVPTSVLRAAVAEQSERFFDRRVGTAVVNARRMAGSGQVLAAAADADAVRLAAHLIQAAGLRLESIEVAGAPPGLGLGPERPAWATSPRLLRAGLFLGVVWGVSGAAAAGYLARATAALDRELAGMAPAIASMRSLSAELRAAEAHLSVIDRTRKSPVRLVAPLALLSRALVDSMFLASYEVDSTGVVRVDVLGRRTLEMMALLESADVGVVTSDGASGRTTIAGVEWERVQVRLHGGGAR